MNDLHSTQSGQRRRENDNKCILYFSFAFSFTLACSIACSMLIYSVRSHYARRFYHHLWCQNLFSIRRKLQTKKSKLVLSHWMNGRAPRIEKSRVALHTHIECVNLMYVSFAVCIPFFCRFLLLSFAFARHRIWFHISPPICARLKRFDKNNINSRWSNGGLRQSFIDARQFIPFLTISDFLRLQIPFFLQ